MGFAFRGKPTGNGVLPLAKIFETLLASLRKANVIVEQWPPFHESSERPWTWNSNGPDKVSSIWPD